jgi:hypothetical protein
MDEKQGNRKMTTRKFILLSCVSMALALLFLSTSAFAITHITKYYSPTIGSDQSYYSSTSTSVIAFYGGIDSTSPSSIVNVYACNTDTSVGCNATHCSSSCDVAAPSGGQNFFDAFAQWYNTNGYSVTVYGQTDSYYD